jgi:hypothetical protein
MAATVARVYNSLPPDERAKTAIFGNDFGQSGAIDFYGPALGLPPAISGHNQYGFWGPRGHDGSVVLRINGDEKIWRQRCASLEVVARVGARSAMHYENDAPISRPRHGHAAAELWPKLRHID